MNKLIKLKELANKILDFIYKYRFIIAIVLVAVGVLFGLHGSSISLWNTVQVFLIMVFYLEIGDLLEVMNGLLLLLLSFHNFIMVLKSLQIL